jgi:hypothetical protein
MFRTLTLLAIILATTACDTAQPGAGSPPTALSWRSGPEGSKVASEGAGSNQAIRRCWPGAGGWDCLFVQLVGAEFFANRYWRESLESGQELESIIGGSGYDCEFAGGAESPTLGTFRESISKGRRTIVENTFNLLEPSEGWSEAVASRLMVDNGIKPDRPFFRCAALARQLIFAGAEAVNSNAVTYRSLTE